MILVLAWCFAAVCASSASAGFDLFHQNVVDVPISLGKGTIRTREFGSKKDQHYLILVVARRGHLPLADMNCMMGVSWDNLNSCAREPLLQADWKVIELDRGIATAVGSIHESGGGEVSDRSLGRYLGHFDVRPGRRYILEVQFTSDGTPLDVAQPHLVVEIEPQPWG
jgi:hypothetical protein